MLLEPFPTLEAFDAAAHAFLAKYAGRSAAVLGPERTNVGWEWRRVSSKASTAKRHVWLTATQWRGEQGYLYRRTAKWVTTVPPPSPPDDAEPEPVDEGALFEEEEDAATVSTTTTTRAPRRIEREYTIAWSPTYRVPMLCVRAWDASEHLPAPVASRRLTAPDGVPLPLDAIVAHVLRAGAAALTTGERRHDALMMRGAGGGAAPFPLLQQTEQPVTGEIVWSVHPCEVRGAVADILRRAEEDDDEEEEEEGEFGVRWLETWVMLSDSVVDLAM